MLQGNEKSPLLVRFNTPICATVRSTGCNSPGAIGAPLCTGHASRANNAPRDCLGTSGSIATDCMGATHHRAARNISPVGRRARHALPRDSGNRGDAASDSLSAARDILESRCAPIFIPSRPAEITQVGTQIGKDGVPEALKVTMLRIVKGWTLEGTEARCQLLRRAFFVGGAFHIGVVGFVMLRMTVGPRLGVVIVRIVGLLHAFPDGAFEEAHVADSQGRVERSFPAVMCACHCHRGIESDRIQNKENAMNVSISCTRATHDLLFLYKCLLEFRLDKGDHLSSLKVDNVLLQASRIPKR
ncbi:hypothetical protein KC345_g54 [Hortaea werneckii]|nr:hypothetical protein KC345_g54 [Hortaea werneckii]